MNWVSASLCEVAPAQPARFRFRDADVVWHLNLDQVESGTGQVMERIVAPASAAGNSTYAFDTGNVLYSKLRPYLNKVVCPDQPGIATTELVPLRPKGDLLNRQFLALFLRSKPFVQFASQTTAGAKMPRVMMDKLREFRIPLPPLSEQRRVVEILDQADALRKMRAEADAKAARILPALFYRMFGDPSSNPRGWERLSLRQAGARVRYGLGQPPEFSSEGVPFIRATNICKGAISEVDLRRVDPKSVPVSRDAFLSSQEVLVVRSGVYTGDVAQVTEVWQGAVAGYDLVISPGENLVGEFLEWYFLTPHIQGGHFVAAKTRAAQPHLNSRQMESTPVLKPPLSIQQKFAEHVKAIRERTRLAAYAESSANNARDVLFHRAFTGELTAAWREKHRAILEKETAEQARMLEEAKSTSAPPRTRPNRGAKARIAGRRRKETT